MGYTFFPKLDSIDAVVNPTVTDDEDYGYEVGSTWVNTVSGEVFNCTDATAGAAVWNKTFRKNRVTTIGVDENVSIIGEPYYVAGLSDAIYSYSFIELYTNLFLRGGVTFVPDGLGGYNYIVNRRGLLPPFSLAAVTEAVNMFTAETGVTPVDVGVYGQSEGASDKYYVVSGVNPNIVFVANLFRDYATGLRKVMYSVEDSGGGTTTMLNGIRYEESAPNTWGSPIINPQFNIAFGGPIAVEINGHFTATFNI